mmetsp:Transcript_3074/g.7856  ORF Transcript_3074/g.7856 Transcript_3074/m.7856 type:complete len:555 (+) Transcript_3074:81-1745(+)
MRTSAEGDRRRPRWLGGPVARSPPHRPLSGRSARRSSRSFSAAKPTGFCRARLQQWGRGAARHRREARCGSASSVAKRSRSLSPWAAVATQTCVGSAPRASGACCVTSDVQSARRCFTTCSWAQTTPRPTRPFAATLPECTVRKVQRSHGSGRGLVLPAATLGQRPAAVSKSGEVEGSATTGWASFMAASTSEPTLSAYSSTSVGFTHARSTLMLSRRSKGFAAICGMSTDGNSARRACILARFSCANSCCIRTTTSSATSGRVMGHRSWAAKYRRSRRTRAVTFARSSSIRRTTYWSTCTSVTSFAVSANGRAGVASSSAITVTFPCIMRSSIACACTRRANGVPTGSLPSRARTSSMCTRCLSTRRFISRSARRNWGFVSTSKWVRRRTATSWSGDASNRSKARAKARVSGTAQAEPSLLLAGALVRLFALRGLVASPALRSTLAVSSLWTRGSMVRGSARKRSVIRFESPQNQRRRLPWRLSHARPTASRGCRWSRDPLGSQSRCRAHLLVRPTADGPHPPTARTGGCLMCPWQGRWTRPWQLGLTLQVMR